MYIWLALTILFLVTEAVVPGLVSIWFALAAAIVTLVAGLIEDTMNQFYLFVGLSFLFLVITRPLSKKLLSKREEKLEDRIIGQLVEIKEKISHGEYEVYLDGKYWKARCDEELRAGDKARVLRIKGIRLILDKE